MTNEPSQAEDILQEAFLTIWRRAASYDHTRSSVFSWAVHVTRCKAIDHLRASSRRARGVQTAEPASVSEVEDSDPLFLRDLESLTPDQSQAIETAFFNDLTHRDISVRLGQPLSTIKARMRRGLLTLNERLRES